jgi:putative protein kinase ArgK-like GTPase of G3E family
MKFSTEELIEGIRSGNKRLIAKAITLVESKKAEHRIQAEELLKKSCLYRKFIQSRSNRCSRCRKINFY